MNELISPSSVNNIFIKKKKINIHFGKEFKKFEYKKC